MAQTLHAIFDRGHQDLIDYTPSVAVTGGSFVFHGAGLGALVSVALVDLPANVLGAVEITGRYKVKKKSGTAFAIGENVGWDEGLFQAVAAADGTNDRELGVCVKAALAADDFVIVKINFARGWDSSS